MPFRIHTADGDLRIRATRRTEPDVFIDILWMTMPEIRARRGDMDETELGYEFLFPPPPPSALAPEPKKKGIQ